mmetsp:Transcript_116/g.290  ORF Transcript_116/g.290 Transcript_116/m.290 type:complete len:311 (-) Transcript_116:161-1093(-)|eukprot:CAMPEP_0119411742 /NCGR_PEP_ID=MMETSP1335-20130426/4392_1 /TAXON_ID=259385 /ORGANISM="Chrysoculter rhomboideus, Strain RCC1486" /LENGTH=310 /DNA_ID=CAMNT_0007436411 /DNA_START=42 /DNA_END=974 /DNA_ORIENTATION=+
MAIIRPERYSIEPRGRQGLARPRPVLTEWLPYARVPTMLAFAMGAKDQNCLVSMLGTDELQAIFNQLQTHDARAHSNNGNHLLLARTSYKYFMDRASVQDTNHGIAISWVALGTRKTSRKQWVQQPRGLLDAPQEEAAHHTGALLHALSVAFELPASRSVSEPMVRFSRASGSTYKQRRLMRFVLDAMIHTGVRVCFSAPLISIDVRGTIAKTLGIPLLTRVGCCALWAWQTRDFTFLYASGPFRGREKELELVLGPGLIWVMFDTSGMDQTMLADQRMLELDASEDMLMIRMDYTLPLGDSVLKPARIF